MDDIVYRSLARLRHKILDDRSRELRTAVSYRDSGDEAKALYHTGLADGRNEVAKDIRSIMEGVKYGA